MNFFEAQDEARRNTRRLVVFFTLAVVCIVVVVNVAAAFLFSAGEPEDVGSPGPLLRFDPALAAVVTLATVGLILIGSLYKMAVLREGGESIARLLGGRPIDPNTDDRSERRLLNVVEEMAVASGCTVPETFVLEKERSINAFAAGTTVSDAVIGVSKGCLEHLSRDELQGVVAHEFSHIVNGDMKLNLRLVGILHGILMISLVGWGLLRAAQFGAYGRRRESGNAALVMLAFGAVLLLVGGIGVFFGRLIKSGVSRQREFLADSAAVQFTRNPSGLAGALKKIGGLAAGSRLESKHAEQASHFFFAYGLRGRGGWLSTHPPLDDRIQRLEPAWDGSFPKLAASAEASSVDSAGAGIDPRGRALVTPLSEGSSGPVAGVAGPTPEPGGGSVSAQGVVDRVGELHEEYLAYAHRLLADMPRDVHEWAHEPTLARLVVFSLLLDEDEHARSVQLASLERSEGPVNLQWIHFMLPTLRAQSRAVRLPLVELCAASLRRLSGDQYVQFLDAVDRLVDADEHLSLFELALRTVLVRRLESHFRGPQERARQVGRTPSLRGNASVLLTALARAASPEDPAAVFEIGARLAGVGGVEPVDGDRTDWRLVAEALQALAEAPARVRRRLVDATIAVVSHDGRIEMREAELLQVVVDSLDCPLPPLSAGTAPVGHAAPGDVS